MFAKTWVNGLLGETVSITDRGFMYGQSVFETIAVANATPFLLEEHLARLQKGCKALSIPYQRALIQEDLDTAIKSVSNKAVLRISISMGEGGRGYQNPDAATSNRVVSLTDYPEFPKAHYSAGIELGLAQIKLAQQPVLAGIKHSNRLEQIIARSEWHPDWQEALLLNQHDQVIEATQSNVFIVQDSRLMTPDLTSAGVAGVMRNFILSNAELIGAECKIMPLSLTDIERADEVFVSNSLIGLWPVRKFQDIDYNNFIFSQKLLTLLQDYGAIPTI